MSYEPTLRNRTQPLTTAQSTERNAKASPLFHKPGIDSTVHWECYDLVDGRPVQPSVSSLLTSGHLLTLSQRHGPSGRISSLSSIAALYTEPIGQASWTSLKTILSNGASQLSERKSRIRRSKGFPDLSLRWQGLSASTLFPWR